MEAELENLSKCRHENADGLRLRPSMTNVYVGALGLSSARLWIYSRDLKGDRSTGAMLSSQTTSFPSAHRSSQGQYEMDPRLNDGKALQD